MKTKTITLLTGMILIICSCCVAQHPNNSVPVIPNSPGDISSWQKSGNYSFRVFIAPNKSFGYDIIMQEKLVFHQPAFSLPNMDNKLMLTKKEQASTAALLAIEKIKKGMSPVLTREELSKIAAQ